MAWGQAGARGIDDLVRRVAANDLKLESLTILRQRRFNHDDVLSLVRAMASNTHLRELYASSHPLTPHTAALVADILECNQSLRSLSVGDSSLGDDGVVALARGVASSSLTRLDLSGKGLGMRGAEALASALCAAAMLTHLVLSSNHQLGDAGLRALCSNIKESNGDPAVSPTAKWRCLRTLELQSCGITASGIQALAASANSAQLHVLYLDGNHLGTAGGEALAALLKSAVALRELHLRQTGLGDEGGEALASALTGGSLAVLGMAYCGLGQRTMSTFRRAFVANVLLRELDLTGNTDIGDAEAALFGGSLAACSASVLERLDLSATQAGPQTALALSEAPSLRHLSLVGCALGTAGATALASSLSSGGWARLEELFVSGTSLSMADMGALFAAVAAGGGPNLKSMEVGANPATQQDAFSELLESLRVSRPELLVFWRAGDDPGPVMKP